MIGLISALEEEIAIPLTVPKNPHFIGAIGAALEAYDDGVNNSNNRTRLKVKRKHK